MTWANTFTLSLKYALLVEIGKDAATAPLLCYVSGDLIIFACDGG
jgi:hypothetical protein